MSAAITFSVPVRFSAPEVPRLVVPFEELWIVPRQIYGNDQCRKYECC